MKMFALVSLCFLSVANADPGALLASDLTDAAAAAAVDCVEVGPESGGAACAADFAARTAVALLSFGGAMWGLWGGSPDTSPYVLPAGQTCFNFGARDARYSACCAYQKSHVCNDDDDACLLDKGCIPKDTTEFAPQMLNMLHLHFKQMNAQYEIVVGLYTGINIQDIIANKRWLDLQSTCREMMSNADRFLGGVSDAKQVVKCANPSGVCQYSSTSSAFQVHNGEAGKQTCLSKIQGGCYNKCCDAQRSYCGGDDQCRRDRGCRLTNPDDNLQETVCEKLTSCADNMQTAVEDVQTMKDCVGDEMAGQTGGTCSYETLRSGYARIGQELGTTRSSLVSLENMPELQYSDAIQPQMLVEDQQDHDLTSTAANLHAGFAVVPFDIYEQIHADTEAMKIGVKGTILSQAAVIIIIAAGCLYSINKEGGLSLCPDVEQSEQSETFLPSGQAGQGGQSGRKKSRKEGVSTKLMVLGLVTFVIYGIYSVYNIFDMVAALDDHLGAADSTVSDLTREFWKSVQTDMNTTADALGAYDSCLARHGSCANFLTELKGGLGEMFDNLASPISA